MFLPRFKSSQHGAPFTLSRAYCNPHPQAAALQAHSHGSITVCKSSLHRIKASRVQYKAGKKPLLLPYLVNPLALAMCYVQTEKKGENGWCFTSFPSTRSCYKGRNVATPLQDAFAASLFTYCTVLLFTWNAIPPISGLTCLVFSSPSLAGMACARNISHNA